MAKVKAAAPRREESGKKVIRVDDPTFASFGTIHLKIEGTSPLICHKFSMKAKRMILDKQMGRSSRKKAPRNPDEDFIGSLHFIGQSPETIEEWEAKKKTWRYGMPADALKASAVRGAKLGDVAMTDSRTMFFVEPESGQHDNLVEILSDEPPFPRQDHVRITNTSDVRIRGTFENWSANLRITYHARACTSEQVVGWFNAAGVCVGIGEWRPLGRASSGVFGRFKVVEATAFVPPIAD